jgi:hypothetical protein
MLRKGTELDRNWIGLFVSLEQNGDLGFPVPLCIHVKLSHQKVISAILVILRINEGKRNRICIFADHSYFFF